MTQTIRLIFISTLSLACFNVFSQPQKIDVKNKNLLEAVDWYLKSCNKYFDSISFRPNKPGAVLIQFYNSNFKIDPFMADSSGEYNKSHYYLTTGMFLNNKVLNNQGVANFPPSYYFFHNETPVVIYTGLEELVNTDPKDLKRFNKSLRKTSSFEGLPKYPAYDIEINEHLKSGKTILVKSKGYH